MCPSGCQLCGLKPKLKPYSWVLRFQDGRRLANFVAWALPRAAGVRTLSARFTAKHQDTELQARPVPPKPSPNPKSKPCASWSSTRPMSCRRARSCGRSVVLEESGTCLRCSAWTLMAIQQEYSLDTDAGYAPGESLG